MAKTSPAMTPSWRRGRGNPTAVADDPRPPVGGEGEPEEVEGKVEAGGGRGEDLEVEGVEELLDIQEQRCSGRGSPRATSRGDLCGRGLSPDDVSGGFPLPRAEDWRCAGKGGLPGAGAAVDDGAEHAVERGEDADGPKRDPVRLGNEGRR